MKTFFSTEFNARLFGLAATAAMMTVAAGTATAARMDLKVSASLEDYSNNTYTDPNGLAQAATFESFRSSSAADSAATGALVFSNATNLGDESTDADGGAASITGTDANFAVGDTNAASSSGTVDGATMSSSSSSVASSFAASTGAASGTGAVISSDTTITGNAGPTPEPSSIIMLGSGLLLIFAGSRRRK